MRQKIYQQKVKILLRGSRIREMRIVIGWQVLLGSKEIPAVVDRNFKVFVRRFSPSREWQVLLGSKEIAAKAGIEIYNLEMLWYFVCNHIEKLNLKSIIVLRVCSLNPIPAEAGISLFTLFILSFQRKLELPYLSQLNCHSSGSWN